MSAKNDGGPAFPAAGLDINHPLSGMSLRDWFAGQAPTEIQPWFRVNVGPKPEDKWGASLSDMRFTNYNYAIEWCRKNGGTPVNHAFQAQQAYERDVEKQTFIQWPWAWADAMLAARSAASTARDQT